MSKAFKELAQASSNSNRLIAKDWMKIQLKA